jgi:hypothetical protein
MKTLLGCLMISNAALFFFGAVQHLGIAIGPFHEPHIIPAAVWKPFLEFRSLGALPLFSVTRSSTGDCL